MQPYVNPLYFQNPFFTNFGNNTSQTIPNSYSQPVGISGKYVNDFAEVTASDVPMGSQPSVFIKNDRSEMQIREWSPNGQIVTTLFKPCLNNQEINQANQEVNQAPFDAKSEVLDPILDKLAELEQQVAKLSNTVAKPTTKKAVAE